MHFSPPEGDDEGQKTKITDKEKERREKLFTAIEDEEFPVVEGILTAKTIMSCGSNPLLVAMDVRTDLINLSKKSVRMT